MEVRLITSPTTMGASSLPAHLYFSPPSFPDAMFLFLSKQVMSHRIGGHFSSNARSLRIPTAREEEWIFLPSVDVYLDPKHLNKSHRGDNSTLTSDANAESNSAASTSVSGHGAGCVTGSGSAQGATARSRAAQASGQGKGVRMGGASKGAGKRSGQGSEGSPCGMSMDSVAGWLKDVGLGGYARVRMTTTARPLAHPHTI